MTNSMTVSGEAAMGQGKGNIQAYQTEVIDSLGALNLLADEWAEFHGSAQRQNLLHDARHICFELGRHDSRYSPLCIVVRKNGAVECVAPFFVDSSVFHLQCSTMTLFSMKCRLLRLFGNDFLFKKNEDSFDCIDVVFDAIKKIDERFDILFLECLETSSPLWRYCCDRRKMKRFALRTFSTLLQPDKIYRLKMPASKDEWLKSLPRKRRQSFSWQTRKFKGSVEGPVRFLTVLSEPDISPFLDALDKLFPATWQAKTYGVWNRNSDKEVEYFQSMARVGALRAYLLLDGDKAVAFLIGFQYKGTYYYEEIGYDPDYSHLGPGGVLNSLFMEDLYKANPPSVIDFGFGTNTYKKVLSNVTVDADRLCIVGAPKWCILLVGQKILTILYHWAREIIKESKAERWLKKVFKSSN